MTHESHQARHDLYDVIQRTAHVNMSPVRSHVFEVAPPVSPAMQSHILALWSGVSRMQRLERSRQALRRRDTRAHIDSLVDRTNESIRHNNISVMWKYARLLAGMGFQIS